MFIVLLSGCREDLTGGMLEPCDLTPPLASTISPTCGATGVALNQVLTATFTEDLEPSSLNTSTVVLTEAGGTQVTGTVAYNVGTNVVTFTPSSLLSPSTTYTYTIKSGDNGIKDLFGNVLPNDFVCSFTTGLTPDTTAPTVIATDPDNNETGVLLNSLVTATFSEAMDPLTVNGSSFLLSGPGSTPVAGSVTYAGPSFTAVFSPNDALAPNTTYTATITTQATDGVGNPLAANYVWTFTTGVGMDMTRPEVLSTDPQDTETGVAVGTDVTATFSEAMAPSSVSNNSFFLMDGTTMIAGTVSYSGVVATFNPTSELAPNTTYTATVTTGATDLAGNAIAANHVWTFTTAAVVIAPEVTSTDPQDLETDVALNTDVTATFSEVMDPLTISTSSFTLMDGTTPVDGLVSYLGTTATFNPTNDLNANTTYTATITTGATDLAGNPIQNDFVWSFTTAAAVIAPEVTSTDPQDLETDVVLNTDVMATFSKEMDPLTITNSSFTLMDGTTPVDGLVSYLGTTATFNPTNDLNANTTYTATITTDATDLDGNPIENDFVWTFTTAAAVIAPEVTSTDPQDLETDVVLNTDVMATFSKEMDPLTITNNSFTLMDGTTPVDGSVSYLGTTATFNPTNDLNANTTYTATITTDATDLDGNPIENDFVWTFTTAAAGNAPEVTSTDPQDLETDVVLNTDVMATFSEEMDPLTITNSSFTLMDGSASVDGLVSYLGTTATFNPTNDLNANTTYTATITTDATDLDGNPIENDFVWTFTTAGIVVTGPLAVDLTCAEGFAVIAGSGITSTGPSIVNGDVALSPGSALVGFPPGVVNGTVHINDTTANDAKGCLTAAFNDAAGRAPGTSVSGNIGGMTLTPGVYTAGSGLAVSSGDLTLDAQGDANGVFIFQIPSTFTMTSGLQVILAGNAQAKNVFWQVGSSATIGTNAIMMGTIMADQSITLETGAVLNGAALARIAAVTLDASTINVQ